MKDAFYITVILLICAVVGLGLYIKVREWIKEYKRGRRVNRRVQPRAMGRPAPDSRDSIAQFRRIAERK